MGFKCLFSCRPVGGGAGRSSRPTQKSLLIESKMQKELRGTEDMNYSALSGRMLTAIAHRNTNERIGLISKLHRRCCID